MQLYTWSTEITKKRLQHCIQVLFEDVWNVDIIQSRISVWDDFVSTRDHWYHFVSHIQFVCIASEGVHLCWVTCKDNKLSLSYPMGTTVMKRVDYRSSGWLCYRNVYFHVVSITQFSSQDSNQTGHPVVGTGISGGRGEYCKRYCRGRGYCSN